MPRKRNSASVWNNAVAIADEIHLKDQAAEARSQEDRGQRSLLLLAQIQPRPSDTRPVHAQHVEELVESIAALGLIEPLVVDNQSVLLAGAHRLAAINLLKENHPEQYAIHFGRDLVPVRIMPFDATDEPELALQVELAENEKRVNYSREQIQKLAVRLRQLNYKDTRGRPKKGEKALGPALAVAIGVSTRYVRQVLGEQKSEPTSKNRNSVPIFRRRQLLKKLESVLEELALMPELDADRCANQQLDMLRPDLLQKVKQSLVELEG
ncbi:MAG TPA: ParB/RepB/Spo0J family partition protein [Leptolyngbyaceae cyanobacterium]